MPATGIPSWDEAVSILNEAGCTPDVVGHCKSVSKLAVEIADRLRIRGFEVDVDLVKIGALLHDIGRSQTHRVDHCWIGAELAQKRRLPESIVNIIMRHVGAGISAEEARLLGLPRNDYIPKSLEEKVVSYADKLIEADRRVEVEAAIRRLSDGLGAGHPSVTRLRRLHEELSSMLGGRL